MAQKNHLTVEEGLPMYNFKPRKSLKYGLTGDEESLFFNDGRRRIDFVLVYQTGTKASDQKKLGKRASFQDQMEEQGIDFELQSQPIPGEPAEVQLCFVKLHATWDLLTRYADIMKIRMPLKKEVEDEHFQDDQISRHCPNPLRVDRTLLPTMPHYISAAFSTSKEQLFNITDKESFFSPSIRSRIIWECLTRIQFAQSNPSRIGIQKLLADGTFLAAFPLHDGNWETDTGKKPSNLRAILYDQWGQFLKWSKFQPIDYIRNYFGERTGFYFAWMEFYTLMLLPAMLVGLICIIYGLATVGSDVVVNEVCTAEAETIMCPICDRRCPYWKMKESCSAIKATYLIDNASTVCFALFMALWSSLFIILWKRKQTILSWNFDTYYATEQEEPVRPELEAQIKPDKWKINPVTQVNEPYVSPTRRILQSVLSVTVVIFMVIVVLAATIGIVVYRTAVNWAIYATLNPDDDVEDIGSEEQKFVVRNSMYIVGFTASILNLIVILTLNSVYYRIAKWLTEKEYPRTQTEYEDSLTIKYYVFEFVNTYTSLFYVAFFKGRVPPPLPGGKSLFDLPYDRCDKGGCLIELTIQLVVLFLGSGIVNFIVEIVVPSIVRAIRNRRHQRTHRHMKFDSRWEKDYDLQAYPNTNMFMEYSRMVTQFGFVTMFVAAFPLAPLFALINNLIEIRLDAYKYLTLYRRPVASWARNIGAWGKILENVARFAVITNGFIIAFSTDFVPKMVYLVNSEQNLATLVGYTKWSLSEFSIPQMPFEARPNYLGQYWSPDETLTTCYYREFRSSPTAERPYMLNMKFWHVFAARVILVLVFEHFVMLMAKVFCYFVPDMPDSLKAKVLRENFLARESFYEAESQKTKASRTRSAMSAV